MQTALWIVTAVLAFVFLASGLTKLFQPKQRLHDSGMTYVEDFPAAVVKAVGAVEVLGALGLVLPVLFDTRTFLVPVAASGLVLTMGGAVAVHVRRREPFLLPLLLAVAALVVAVLRLGPYAV